MGTEKRERQKANKAARLAAEEKAAARRRQIRLVRNAVILVIVIVIAGFIFAGCGSEDSEGSAASTDSGEADPTTSPSTLNPRGTVAPDQTNPGSTPDATYGTTACPPADGVDEPQIDFDTGFAECIDPAKTYTATVETTRGTVTVGLDVLTEIAALDDGESTPTEQVAIKTVSITEA